VVNPQASRQYIRAKAAALAGHEAKPDGHASGHGGEAHWAYEGENGPQAWGKLKPEFNVCAIGKRQSPINIEETGTLQGPAEPLQFHYMASSGTVVNNGHTIQVDVLGDNSITVRGSNYKLLQFHFHHPSEEKVNYRGFAMVAHLVHRNAEGQLAVVAVLLDPGTANNLINKVWTYMPLDAGDRVRMPIGLVDLNELLPRDQRYYQFMGSLTTPPCTEGVLWLVLKQPVAVSREQIRLFSQLFPNNARPVQALNGRPVRDAQ
jgi:carbonic anhydrase